MLKDHRVSDAGYAAADRRVRNIRAHVRSVFPVLCLTAALLLFSGCNRGPEGLLVGRWELDVEASLAAMEEKDEDAAGLAGVFLSQGRRVLNFASDGTMHAAVYTEGGRHPGMIGGLAMHEEEGDWEIIEAKDGRLTVRITGGEREFAEWERVLHFETDDRFYYDVGPDQDVRQYWTRQ